MKVSILKYDHRHGCDLSGYETPEMANEARAKICVQFVDDRIYTPPTIDDDPNVTVSAHVKQLYEAGNFDECVRAYLSYNQDESLDIEEIEIKCTTDLRYENMRLKRELAEALRELRKSTGCNWEETIKLRALPWVKRKTCETCKGLGEIPVDKWSAFCGHLPSRCTACNGNGEIYEGEPHDPNGPPCNGCPDIQCSDYELCSRKKLT